jgi:hypothetical protein
MAAGPVGANVSATTGAVIGSLAMTRITSSQLGPMVLVPVLHPVDNPCTVRITGGVLSAVVKHSAVAAPEPAGLGVVYRQ